MKTNNWRYFHVPNKPQLGECIVYFEILMETCISHVLLERNNFFQRLISETLHTRSNKNSINKKNDTQNINYHACFIVIMI